MKHRFMLITEMIEVEKEILLEAGETLIRSIKTGKLYPVKTFNPTNHMRPTPAQIDKYYREKAGVFPSDAAKDKYNKTKPKAKKKKLPPKKKVVKKKSLKKLPPKKKKVTKKKTAEELSYTEIWAVVDEVMESSDDAATISIMRLAKEYNMDQEAFEEFEDKIDRYADETGFSKSQISHYQRAIQRAFVNLDFKAANYGAKKEKQPSQTVSISDSELKTMNDQEQQDLTDTVESTFEDNVWGKVNAQIMSDKLIHIDFELPGGAKKDLYVGWEDTDSSGGGGSAWPKIVAWYPDASGTPKRQTFFDMDDLSISLEDTEWAGSMGKIVGNDADNDDDEPEYTQRGFDSPLTAPWVAPEGGKVRSKKLNKKSLSDDAKKRTYDWRKLKVGKTHGHKYLTKMQNSFARMDKQNYHRDGGNYYGDITEYAHNHNFGDDMSQAGNWQKYVKESEELTASWRENNSLKPNNETAKLAEVQEHIDKTRSLINRELTNPFVFRAFVGDDFEQDSWQLSMLSNLAAKRDPTEDYRYKTQGAGKKAKKKPDADWKKDMKTFKKIKLEQQEVLKKMGFVNDDGTVTLVRAVDVPPDSVPRYDKKTNGITPADYTGSAADSWTLDYATADGWDASEGSKMVVKARVPLEKVIASAYGLPPQHIMERGEHEVIIDSTDLPGAMLYPDYRDRGPDEEDMMTSNQHNKRDKNIMEKNDDKLDERRKRNGKKVKVNVNNKDNIDWLRNKNKKKRK